MKPETEVPEEMVNLTQAVIETQQLRAWFYALKRLPASVRETTFSEMAAEMRRASDASGLADAVASLAIPKIYQSVLETIRERAAGFRPGPSGEVKSRTLALAGFPSISQISNLLDSH